MMALVDVGRPNPSDARLLAGAGLVALLGLVVGGAAAPFSYDDAWITFRYAYNLAAGHGFVYNPGERVFGTTAPGYALLVGLLSLPAPEWVPRIGGILCAIALSAVSTALYVFGARHRAALAGFVAGLVFLVNPLALDSFGGEMVPQAALATWGLVAASLGRPMLATLLGIGAAVLRPDGVVALAVILAWLAWRDRRIPVRPLALAAGTLAIWFGALWMYFGTPLPDTLAAKQAQRTSGMWHAFGTDFVIWVLGLSDVPTPFLVRTQPGFTAFLALAVAGVFVLPWRRAWWGLVAWPIALLLAYRQLRLPFYHWYAVPPLVLMAVSAGLAADAMARAIGAILAWRIADPARRMHVRAGAAILVGAVVGAAVFPMGRHAWETRQWFPGPGERAYMVIGEWLARSTPPDASVGYLEVGFVGYYARRRIVDPFGLVTPGAGAAVASRDLTYAYRTRRPDFILYSPHHFAPELGPLIRQPWFQAEYAPMATLSGARGEPITVYRRTVPRAPAGAAGSASTP
jgi:hypothetical protein